MSTELISRTNFSLLDGASHPEELVQAAADLGLSHLGIADRDGVYGLVRAHKAARTIVGAPQLVCGASITVEARPSVVLLAETPTGWSNLCRILTAARRPAAGAWQGKQLARSQVRTLAEHAEGLTCILRYGWTASWARDLREAFGSHLELALSVQLAPAADLERARWAQALSTALSCGVVASNDVVYHSPDRRQLADVLCCIRRRTTLNNAGRALRANNARHLLSANAAAERYPAQALLRAQQVAERCSFSLDQLAYHYPREVVPEGWSPQRWLTHLVHEGLARRYPGGVPDSVQQQVRHELSVIAQLDFPSYFLTVEDIVRFARGEGILCQGRGSAANSAVCYALGITSVDPARSALLFERFISAERGEPPDIDVDFEHERREEVIQYIYRRYGRDRAALVDEVICYRRRSAIRDVGKVFGLSLDQVERLAKHTDRWSAGQGVTLAELVREAGLDPDAPEVRRTLRAAESLRGFPRHLSIHVGGFVIAADQLIDLVPVEPANKAHRTVIQWDKYDTEALGFVKVDVLALGMLSAIRRAFELVEGHWGRALTLATVPAEDPAVYEMFCQADTVGVFQIESRAQMSMLPRLQPRCFYDLVIEVAIVRPGPIQGGMVHPYLRRRNGEEPVTYPHPALQPILERTLGVPLFQEQVMAMAVAVGGFTAGQADQLRRAMGAWRKRGTLDGIGQQLVQGMVARGITPTYAAQIFEQIQGFGEYGFPESHAASFALLVYVSGWLRCHHLPAFTAALINSQPMGFYSPRALVADAQRHQVEVRPVEVSVSGWDCSLEPPSQHSDPHGAALRLGLRLVRGLSEPQAQAILRARQQRAFSSLPDLAVRTGLDNNTLQALAEADALRALVPERRHAAWILQGLWTELPLLAHLQRDEPTPALPSPNPTELMCADYRALGLSVEHHPVRLLRPQLQALGVRPLIQLFTESSGRRVRVAGMVSSRQRPGTASGVVFMTLEDETAMANLVVWPKVWTAHRKLARTASMLGIDGELQRQGAAVSVLVHRFWAVEQAPAVAIKARNFH